jgi:hypothetical protein
MKGACLVSDSDTLYLFGGISDLGFHNTLWKYDLGTYEYEIISDNADNGPVPIANHNCFLYEVLNAKTEVVEKKIVVFLGETVGDLPLGTFYAYNLVTGVWELIHDLGDSGNSPVS